MPIAPFKLERFFAQYEFNVRYLLCASDIESLALGDLLEMASPESLPLWRDLRLGYTESAGHPLLRDEVARLYARVPAEQVVIAAPEEAIYVAMHTLLSSGDHVVAVFPAYQSLYEIARSLGCRLTLWSLQAGESGWRLDLNQLEDALRQPTRLLVLNFPHNPTGHLLTQGELQDILGLARRHGVTVLSDEMYRFLEPNPDLRLPAVCDVYEKGISLGGLSKAFALPGLRVGWLATQCASLPAQWLAFKDYTTICNSAPSEILALIALQNQAPILQRNRSILAENFAIAERFFAAHPEQFDWLPPQAGSVAFPRWRGAGTVEQFCQALLEAEGVLLAPGSQFNFPGEHFRVGLGRRNCAAALQRLEAYLQRSNLGNP
jgi:aspartate/methionine/tyrosine aminotransferase